MLFFQESTPDTSAYMIAGYTVAFVIMAIYLASLFIRWRNLDRDLQTLESLEAESKPGVSRQKTPGSKTASRKSTRPKTSSRKKK